MQRKTIYLIDGSSYVYRAFFAIKSHLTAPDGTPTQAIFGFAQMLHKVLKEKKPQYIAVLFDAFGPKFRHEIYPKYKETREAMPDELMAQLGYVKELCDAYGIPRLEKEGYEADDLIASICEWAKTWGFSVVIVSGDKDLHQLVENQSIIQWDPQRDTVYDDKKVEEKFGVPPGKMADFLGLVGDKSDNVPGVPGIGPKRASALLKKVSSIEELYDRINDVKPESLRKKLIEYREQAFLSKKLVLLRKDLLPDITPDFFSPTEADKQRLREIYHRLGFRKFLQDLNIESKDIQMQAHERRVDLIFRVEDLKNVVDQIRKAGFVSVDLETTSENPMDARIVGMAVSSEPHKAYYIPAEHTNIGSGRSQLSVNSILSEFKALLEDDGFPKYGQNLKYERVVLSHYGVNLRGIQFDTMIASYLLEPGQHAHRLEWIVERYLGERMLSYKELTSTGIGGKKVLSFAEVPVDKAAEYAGADAEVVVRLVPLLKERLEQEGLISLFYELEMPLVEVLADMERCGVRVDTKVLKNLSKELDERLRDCEQKIYELAGIEFNIQSPKQLAEILFDKLGLPVVKKTKTGPSTDMSVLETLAPMHPIVQEILAYRSLAKLKNTYVDALPKMVNQRTGRIHTSYNQTVTATGRLSSSDPNLQNIPIRTGEGKRIREAFIPEEGMIFLSADYSQIELRILAHYSEDEGLIEAFRRGEDIHSRTASEIFHVPLDKVTPDMRRFAKTINFGIIYGMGPYGLSKALGVSKREAKEIIDRYFNRYSGVRRFIEKTIEEATERGFCRTLMGRIRHIPELQDRSRTIRQQGERLAVNTTIQGSAADIIKKAMISIFKKLSDRRPSARMVLQVHDELVLEVADNELEEIKSLVKEEMENVVDLKVPLVVDVGIGKNWAEAHS
ncbi:MAG: DNA polymerase I [Deltaproteobacteria bacterium]|nr:DNA polymerase I [Deltaproteobacteria bacterium]MBW2067373.1 DNA polymerase I [Deltaproteobacteria bacterium]